MNHLASESSLYLRQHANNPVDWHPWGDEAIGLAKQLDRPIFLSIGYSACHWCHVMEHESFEDEATAKILNEHFVSIKVDREERPDIDHLYMTALQVMTREGGGWPLSVWLTPDLKPFYAGTYFPPDDRYGRPSFKRLLLAIAEAWRTQRDKIAEQSSAIVEHLQVMESASPERKTSLTPALLDQAARALQRGFDPVNGGFGTAPKFPHALELRLLLRIGKRNKQTDTLHVVRTSLDKMAAGGIYDQIGGGFARYSTDARWLVPHFEKMLYDNALLTSAYVDAWKVTRDPEYRRITEETLEYLRREMTSPLGAFYSTQDADSEGEEGKFYAWSKREIEEVLGRDDAEFINYVYGVTEEGNFEGHNILYRPKTWPQLEKILGQPEQTIRDRVKACAAKLYEVRSKRVWPGRDEKILTSWNGLMIAACAQASMAFGEQKYVDAVVRAADFILTHMTASDGSLFRTCAVGSPPRIPGYLEDYACMIDALVELYQATFSPRWLEHAVDLAEKMIARFADPTGGFFTTAENHRHLIARGKDRYDGSTPSGNAMAAYGLLRLGTLIGRDDFRKAGEATLQAFSSFMEESPGGSAQMLAAVDFHLGPTTEVVVLGDRNATETIEVLQAMRQSYLPNALAVFHDPADGEGHPLLKTHLEGKKAHERATTYVCSNRTCAPAKVGLAEVKEWLELA